MPVWVAGEAQTVLNAVSGIRWQNRLVSGVSGPRQRCGGLARGGFDGFHIAIRQAEVVTDFMDENVGNDGTKGFIMLGPIVEDGTAIEKHHVGRAATLRHRAVVGETHALKQAEDVEGGFGPHFVQYVAGGKIFDAEDDLAAQASKFCWKPAKGLRRELFKIRKGWRAESREGSLRHCRRLLAEEDAVSGCFGHRLNRGEAGHGARCKGQQHQAEQYAAQKLGIGLNSSTHFDIPLNCGSR